MSSSEMSSKEEKLNKIKEFLGDASITLVMMQAKVSNRGPANGVKFDIFQNGVLAINDLIKYINLFDSKIDEEILVDPYDESTTTIMMENCLVTLCKKANGVVATRDMLSALCLAELIMRNVEYRKARKQDE